MKKMKRVQMMQWNDQTLLISYQKWKIIDWTMEKWFKIKNINA